MSIPPALTVEMNGVRVDDFVLASPTIQVL